MYQIIKQIYNGRSLIRALMNLEFEKYFLDGLVLDIGGKKTPSYLKHFKKGKNFKLLNVDFKSDNHKFRIDFEVDKLPFKNNSIDNILMINLIEHIFNHKFLVKEAFRVLKNNGKLIGFVPFFMHIHPDPHDYYRYSKECLEKIFKFSDFKIDRIYELGRGPFAVNFSNISCSLPSLLKVILFPIYYFFDWIFLQFRPNILQRFPLGYIFVISKSN